jgi:hypothetical protein
VQAPAPSFARRHAYAILASVVVFALAGQTANQRWSSPDFWVHLAAVREFASSLLHPGNPLVTGTARDPYMSPYTFALGVLVRVTGADAVTVLAFAGIANGMLLFVALRTFVRRVSTAELAPVFTLAFTLTAWGWSPWRWSGFFDLNSIGTVLPLSSTFASAIGLFTVAAVCDVVRGERGPKLALVVAGAALTLLCHPMTAVWIGCVGAAFVISEWERRDAARTLVVVVAMAGAALLASLWPYFSIWRLLVHANAFDASNAGMYRDIIPRAFLALPGVVLLVVRFARRHRDPLALGAAFNVAVYVFGYLTGHDALGRVLPGFMLMAHVAMAVWLAELLARRRERTRAARAALAATTAIVVAGIVGSAAGAVRVIPRSLVPHTYADETAFASLVAPYRPLTRIIRQGEVVVASHDVALGVAASSGKVIAPPAPAAFVAGVAKRQRTVDTLLSAATPKAEFDTLVRDSHVAWFVVGPTDTAELAPRLIDRRLELALSTRTLRVFRVVQPG